MRAAISAAPRPRASKPPSPRAAKHSRERDGMVGYQRRHPRRLRRTVCNRIAHPHQLRLAAEHAAPPRLLGKGEGLAAGLGALLGNCTVKPALLHGDLWGGNAGFDRAGAPVLFDPAVYYGDREADLAMTELFGGFSA